MYADYQGTRATKEDTFKLIESINGLSPDTVSSEILKQRFDDSFWPKFEIVIQKAKGAVANEPKTDSPSEREILTEILRTVRSIQALMPTQSQAVLHTMQNLLANARIPIPVEAYSQYLDLDPSNKNSPNLAGGAGLPPIPIPSQEIRDRLKFKPK